MGDGRKLVGLVAPAALPSRDVLKSILRSAVDEGKLTWSGRVDQRCRLRDYNMVDVVNVVRQGRIVRVPSFDLHRKAWRIEIADNPEGFTFIVDLALDCEEDFCDCPYVELVTAFYRKGSSREVKEWLATT